MPPSCSHDKSNENIYVASESSITVETYSNKTNDLIIQTINDPNQTKPFSIPHTTNMLDTNVTVDEKYSLLQPPEDRIKMPLHQLPMFLSDLYTVISSQYYNPYDT